MEATDQGRPARDHDRCSFCEATAAERQELIEGARGAICEVCVDMAHGLIVELQQLAAFERAHPSV